jgi:putative membrane protein
MAAFLGGFAMKKSLMAAMCIAALIPLVPAVAQTDPAQVGVSVGAPGAQTGRDFVQFMMMSDKFEIAASQLALERSPDPAIRDFAAHMIAAHRASSDDLKAVSDSTNVGRSVTPPPVFDPQHNDMYHALTASFGRRFDDIYLAQQRDAHREALAHLEGYIDNGRVWQLVRFARRTAPVVRDHLAMLNNLRGDAVAVLERSRPLDGDVTIIEHPDGSRTRVIETE